jgi:hypothetical protein
MIKSRRRPFDDERPLHYHEPDIAIENLLLNSLYALRQLMMSAAAHIFVVFLIA